VLQGINRDNRLFMLANFLFALSYGLWMNLRQLHLAALGAQPAEIGTVFALIAIAGGLFPIPAGILADRLGPRRIIIGGWLLAAVGAVIATLAPTWPVVGLGYVVFMLVIAANPATVSFVLLNTRASVGERTAERVLATVFASWPAAMVFAPVLGGVLADRWGIPVVHGVGALGLFASTGVLCLAADVRAEPTPQAEHRAHLGRNRRFVALMVCYPLVVVALYLGYVLAPTFLAEERSFSNSAIGLLFSTMSVGTLAFRSLLIRLNQRQSFSALLLLVWLGVLLLWQTQGVAWSALAFAGLGGISTVWVLVVAQIGQTVSDQDRGLALGISETLGFAAIAATSWLAGQLYEQTAAHDLPMIAGLIAIPAALLLWLALPLERWARAEVQGRGVPALSDTPAT